MMLKRYRKYIIFFLCLVLYLAFVKLIGGPSFTDSAYLENSLSKISNNVEENNGKKVLNNKEFIDILDLLFKSKVVLIDVNLLKDIRFNDQNPNQNLAGKNLIYQFKNIDGILRERTDNQIQKDIIIAFGIDSPLFKNFNEKLVSNLNQKCKLIQSYAKNKIDLSVNGVYIECNYIVFQIVAIYDKGKYFLTYGDNYETKNKKLFGDVARSFKKFIKNELVIENSNNYYVPDDYARFLFDYDNSEFISACKINNQESLQNNDLSEQFKYVTETLISLNKIYWLDDITLLDWYKNCNLKQSIDTINIAILADQYDEIILQSFKGNDKITLGRTLGFINDSYEIHLVSDTINVNIFLVYKLNHTHQWVSYQYHTKKAIRILPIMNKVCSTDIFGERELIPCDPENYLNIQFGENILKSTLNEISEMEPLNLVYLNDWTKDQWPNVVRFYDEEGIVDEQKTLELINKYYNYNLSKL